MIGSGTFINPLIKVLTTVAILAAIYFLIVKPILDTTEGAVENANHSFGDAFGQDREDALRTARDSALSSLTGLTAGSQPWNDAAADVKACVKRAKDDLPAMKECERLADDASESLHDRNFATSYADGLAAEGRTSDAASVLECVEDAGYEVREMSRCRKLSDQLLFG
jgi:hypothetical protein